MNRVEAGKLGWLKTKQSRKRIQLRLRIAAKNKYARLGKVCRTCQRPISYEKRLNDFCNHSCASSKTNRERGAKRDPRFCANCSKLLRGQRRFCSHVCSRTHKANSWLDGKISGGSDHGVHSFVRRWLIKNRGEKCEQCGWCERHPITKKVPIEVDHADGNFRDHRPQNLRLLCPNCHSLTPTYRGLNKGNGRLYRRRIRTVSVP